MKAKLQRIPRMPVRWRPLVHSAGWCDPGQRITVDPRRPWVAMTFLHEILHWQNPDWTEAKVSRETQRRWKSMGWRGHAALYRALGKWART